MDIKTPLILIPALPLGATLLTAALGKRVLKQHSHWPALAAIAASFVLSLMLCWQVRQQAGQAQRDAQPEEVVSFERIVPLWTWAAIDSAYDGGGHSHEFNIEVVLRADALTAMMLAMVTFISSLVVIYASGYMHGDPGYWRFFTYVSLFVFSMIMLVSVSNFVLLYVFWEAVGACSYLLIGFWFEKPEAAAAGKKAFLVNRVGDFGFALALFLIWTTYGTLNFHDTRMLADDTPVAGVLGLTRLSDGNFVGGGVGLAICLLLLVGACGKSAQFPLHVWLPDAMEGPTPVSALIHAATMVTAGVYMVARCTPLFMVSTIDAVGIDARQVVAIIGCFTALLAALIALTQNDLKRVLAYSTVSQLGYMFLGVGTATLSGITAGMFHLFTHAFFKALLFLGAGSVMHAMGGVIDIRRFGGLRKLMPVTCLTFVVGCLALSGVFPFAGFFSKDAVLAAVHDRAHPPAAHHAHEGDHAHLLIDSATDAQPSFATVRLSDHDLYTVLYYTALVTAFLTALYTFRAFFVTFMGPERVPPEAGHHAHESPAVMVMPLVILAACASVVGFWHHGFVEFLNSTPSLAYRAVQATGPAGGFHLDVAATSLLVAIAGIGVAAFLYLGDRAEVSVAQRVGEGLTRIRSGRAVTDRLGTFFLVWPARFFYNLSSNKFYLDELYGLLIVGPLRLLASASYFFDRRLIDGLVDAVGRIPPAVGSWMRSLQSGLVQFYAMAMVLGLLVLIGTVVLWQLT